MWLALTLACGTQETPPPQPVAHSHHREGHPHPSGAAPSDGTHRFDDAARWSAVFDDPARDEWQRPADVVTALSLAPGQAVADIGAGTGYFNRHLAAAVGTEGRVIPIDIEPTLVTHMTERAKMDGTPQVVPRLGTLTSSALLPGEVDAILMVNTVHHIVDRGTYFRALAATLRPGGRVVIVDYDPDGPEEHGPPKAHRLSLPQVADELAAEGFTRMPWPEALPYQWVGVFKPNAPQ